MSTLRALRLLVLGETWAVPVGVLGLLIGGAVLRMAAPELWRSVGGFLLLVGVIVVLGLSVAGGSRGSPG